MMVFAAPAVALIATTKREAIVVRLLVIAFHLKFRLDRMKRYLFLSDRHCAR